MSADVVLGADRGNPAGVFAGDLAELVDLESDVILVDLASAVTDGDDGAFLDESGVVALESEVCASGGIGDDAFADLQQVAALSGHGRLDGLDHLTVDVEAVHAWLDVDYVAKHWLCHLRVHPTVIIKKWSRIVFLCGFVNF